MTSSSGGAEPSNHVFKAFANRASNRPRRAQQQHAGWAPAAPSPPPPGTLLLGCRTGRRRTALPRQSFLHEGGRA
eukprot:6718214-Pyramimonas_sp.AAC.1